MSGVVTATLAAGQPAVTAVFGSLTSRYLAPVLSSTKTSAAFARVCAAPPQATVTPPRR